MSWFQPGQGLLSEIAGRGNGQDLDDIQYHLTSLPGQQRKCGMVFSVQIVSLCIDIYNLIIFGFNIFAVTVVFLSHCCF